MIWFWSRSFEEKPRYMDGELGVRRRELDDRRLRLGRQVVAHLRHLGLDLGQGGVGVVVELQVDRDRRDALGARGLDVVDAVGAGDHALERRRDEAADEVGVGADVGRRDLDDRDVAARVLADRQRADRLQPGDQDDQVDDDREDRPPDEEIGESSSLAVLGLGRRVVRRLTVWLLTCTAAPWRSLKTPEVTTSSPGLMPGEDRDLVAAARPELHELLAHALVGLALRVLRAPRR